MDDQLLLQVYHRLFDPSKERLALDAHRPSGCTYSDAVVAIIYMLAVIRGRSPRWAQLKKNWPLWMRRLEAISYSQLMRRLCTRSVQLLIAQLNCEFRARLPNTDEKFCDGKPLVVGGFSKDPDAGFGKLPGDTWGRGYKVHVIVDGCGAIDLFTVTPLSSSEPVVMRRLVEFAELRGKLMRGDAAFDSNPLYAEVADAGGRLIAPRKKPGTGLGHGKSQHADRLRAIEELEKGPEALRAHCRHRIRVEQVLGHLTNLPFGLSPLPSFVRRLRRVRLWVMAKVMLYHLYLNLAASKAIAA